MRARTLYDSKWSPYLLVTYWVDEKHIAQDRVEFNNREGTWSVETIYVGKED